MKYHVKFCFTEDKEDRLKSGIWTTEVGKRIIKAELDLEPVTENSDGDIRYETDDAEKFAELMKIAFSVSDGGWWSLEPMPNKCGVFHIHT